MIQIQQFKLFALTITIRADYFTFLLLQLTNKFLDGSTVLNKPADVTSSRDKKNLALGNVRRLVIKANNILLKKLNLQFKFIHVISIA